MSELNFFSLRDPQTGRVYQVMGLVGPPGRDGYIILGSYDNEALLEEAHPTGEAGHAYIVGTGEDRFLYIWDVDMGEWSNVGPLNIFIDAPADNRQYARKNEDWVPVETGFEDAPDDGETYGRKESAWVPIESGFEEAPENGNIYGRRNGAWTPIPAGGGEANTYTTFEALIADAENVGPGSIVRTRGYYAVDDEGAATYEVLEAAAHDWDLEIAEGKYASILERDAVTYRMFGAPLNGIDDDGPAMRKAHAYADSVHTIDGTGHLPVYTCRVENHQGIIYKKDADAIMFNSDIDLSGSVLLVNDANAGWFGIYVWGDNDSLRWTYEPSDAMKATFTQDNHVIDPKTSDAVLPGNIVIRFEEDPYTARDDAGYSYTVARKELLLHELDGLCTSPFTDDWTRAGGEEISVLVSDLVGGGYKTETMYTTFKTSYNFAHPKHGTFVGCDVQLDISADKYCCVVWVKRHNCEIRDFTFRPKADQLHNTKYKNTMIYLWDSYGVKVSGIQGFNASGKKVGSSKATSGYILRLTNCSDVHVSDCRLQGYWGATAMDSVKNIRFDRCHINRLDIHDYFANLWANECVFYNSAIQIGYGRGIASFTNSRFHINPAPGDSYPATYLCAFNMSYGRIFEGTVRVDNCQVYGRNLPDGEFNMFKAEFSPDATSITPHFKFPEIVVTNVQVYSNSPSTHYSYFKITGTRRGVTSGVRPSHVKDVSGDNTARWRYYGRGVDWGKDVTAIAVDQILRVSDSFLDNEDPPKTQFYNKRYYRCTQAGALSFSGAKPTDTSGNEITIGSAKLRYVGPDVIWKSKFAYSVNDICAVSHSDWLPLLLFRCEQAGTSNGFFPTHTTGTVIDGINDPINEPDAVWWTYVAAKAGWCVDWSANMAVTSGQRILVENRLYEVTQAGTLPELPPYITNWSGIHDWGTARLKFIGKQWGAREWYPKDAYCEARGRIYRVANHDGTTSGILPVRGNEYCVDGDVVWKHVSGSNTTPGQTGNDTWQAQTAYNIGNTVVANSNTYECMYDGKMVVPHKTVFKNIVTNMSGGQVFWFYTGTNVPTRAGDKPWTIIAEDCEGIVQGAKFPSGMTKYFGNAGNPNPSVILASTGSGGGGGLADAPSDGSTYGRKDGAWAVVPSGGSGGGTIADIAGLQAALDGKMPKQSVSLDATKDLNVDASVAGFYVTAWNTLNNPPGNSSSIILTLPGANPSSAFCQFGAVLSQNKLYFRTSYWQDSVLNFNAWQDLTGGSGGADGKSAYQLWLDAGNTGTVTDFLASLVGAAGADGAAGPAGLTWKGAWSAATAYVTRDAVSHGGSSFIALDASTNVVPGTNPAKWDVLAVKGADGGGSGDMTTLVYDSDADGKVNAAAVADSAHAVSYIDLSTPPEDGEILIYDGSSDTFKPGSAPSSSGLPEGGTAGQVLSKKSATDYDVEWKTPDSGGGGGSNDSTRNNVRVILDLARYYSAGGTGTMKIAMPANVSTDTFLSGEISGYNHATKTPWRCDFGGWAGGGSWGAFSVVIHPNCPFTSVRPGHDGTGLCILLGTTSTSWQYPIVTVPRVQAAYGGMASLPANWNISIVGSETGITVGTTTSTKTISAT